MNKMKKLAAVLLCMVVVLAGCGSDTAWVYQAQNDQMSAGVYILGQVTAYGTPYADYISENYMYPTTKELLKGETEGMNTSAWIDQEAQRQAMMYYGVQQRAAQYDLVIDDLIKEDAQTMADYVWSGQAASYIYQYEMMYGTYPPSEFVQRMNGTMLEDNGVSKDSLARFYEVRELKAQLFDKLYGEEGLQTPSEDELKQRFDEDYAKAAYTSFYKSTVYDDDDEETKAEKEAANEKAQADAEAFLRRLSEGVSFEQAYYEYEMAEAGLKIDMDALETQMAEAPEVDAEIPEVDPDADDPETADEPDAETPDADESEDDGEAEEPDTEETAGEADAENDTLADLIEYDYDATPTLAEEGDMDILIEKPEEPGDSVLRDGITAAAVGQAVIVEDDYTIYVILRKDLMEDEELFQNYRGVLVERLVLEDFEADLVQAGRELNPTVNQKAVSRYTASKLKVD